MSKPNIDLVSQACISFDALNSINVAQPVARKDTTEEVQDVGDTLHLRRWESAKTHRWNSETWKYAYGDHINIDLKYDLETLRARTSYEIQNNPIVEGVIRTHEIDVVGKEGPELEVQSEDKEFNQLVEDGWKQVYEDPCPSKCVKGPELIRLMIRQFWGFGESILQEVTYRRRLSSITIGVEPVYPKRLNTPPEHASDPKVNMGIRFDDKWAPAQYYIWADNPTANLINTTQEYNPVPADMINHVFERHEPGQVRGIPWLSPDLQTVADIRDYDKYVMMSAKHAAARSVYWYTDNPEVPHIPMTAGETYSIAFGMQECGPPGWKPAMLDPTQPSAQYVPFRNERLRELGRPVCMPLMVVLLSSADSNFASAHYDGQVYMRALSALQSFIDRNTLNWILERIVFELYLQRIVTKIPKRFAFEWTWPVAPYVNPKDAYDALRAQLEDGTRSYSDVLSQYGLRLEKTIQTRKRDIQALQEAGLPELPVNVGNIKPQLEPQSSSSEQSQRKTKAKVSTGAENG